MHIAHLGFDVRDAVGDQVARRPRSGAATDALEEVFDNSRAVRCMGHLWMEHQARVAAVIADRGVGAGAGQGQIAAMVQVQLARATVLQVEQQLGA